MKIKLHFIFILFLLNSLLVSDYIQGQTVTIGTATTTSNMPCPFRAYWQDIREQYIFTAAELTASGLPSGAIINSLAFNIATKSSTQAFTNFTVSFGHTSSSTYSSATWLTPTWVTCYSGNYTTTTGWNTFTFTSNFTWNGTSNIVIQTCFDNSVSNNSDAVYYTAATNTECNNRADGSSGCSLAAGFVDSYRPNIKLAYTAPISGSDIISAGSEPSNIAYSSYQAASITSTGVAQKVWSFTVRDGSGTSDADAFATSISALVISKGGLNSVTSWASSIRQATLYNNSTGVEVASAEVSVTGESISFSGLTTLTAPDNGSRTYDLYLTFETTVTDNQQYQFQILNTNVTSTAGSYSPFSSFTAITSSVTADKGRIEVTASKLKFSQQPTNVLTLTNITPAVTVEVTDVNNNRDLDYTSSIRITATGPTLTGTPVIVACTSGLATFSSLQFTTTSTGATLTAVQNATLDWSVTSSTFDVTANPCAPISVFPYNQGFESITVANTLPSCMVATNLTTKVFTYIAPTGSYNQSARTGTDYASFKYSSNDWIFSEGLSLTAGVTYNFSFWYITDGLSGWTTLNAFFGNAQTSGSMTTAITGASVSGPTNTSYVKLSGTFTPSTTGTFYYGIHCTSTVSPWYISIDDISVDLSSASSDIISSSNEQTAIIDYKLKQTTPIAAVADGLKVWSFTLRDGSAGLNDPDALPTDISTLRITKGTSNTVTSWANTIRSAAIFDGTTLVKQIDVATESLDFTGLTTLVSADNSSKLFDLYLTFETTVTDKQQFQFLIDNENQAVGASSSTLGTFTPTSSVGTSTTNVIGVTATKLLFLQQPTTVAVSATMSPAVTVQAVDANGSRDLDYVTNISITSNGTLTGTTVTVAAVAGLATFSTLTHTMVQTGRTLTANSGSFAAITSTPTFDVTLACAAFVISTGVPFTENFDGVTTVVPALTTCWFKTSASAPTYDWKTSTFHPNSGANSLYISYDYTLPLDDWAYTKALTLPAGKTYRVSFQYRVLSSLYTEKLEVKWGNAQTAVAMTGSTIFSNTALTNTTYTEGSGTFVAGSSGDFYVGFHAFSLANQDGIFIDDVKVEEYIVPTGESDIVSAGGETPNINYSAYQVTPIVTAGINCVKVWSFTVRDGGTDFIDADALQTSISSITITKGATNSVGSWLGTIRRAAIFDNNGTLVKEIAVTGESLAFTGLTSLVDADGGTGTTYHLYLSFNATVTDNEQFQFKITNVETTPEASTSIFSTYTASSDVASDNNRIEVTATNLTFTTQPTNTYVTVSMSPAVVIKAFDALTNIDLDVNGIVTITSTGSILNTPVTADITNGVSTFINIKHSVIGTNLTLAANIPSPSLTGTSGLFNIISNPCSISSTPAATDGVIKLCTSSSDISLTANYSGSETPLTYIWALGDGSSATTQTVTHTYPTAAGYKTTVTVKYGASNLCSTELTIEVSPGPVVSNISTSTEIYLGDSYNLNASSTVGSTIQISGFQGTGAVALSLAQQTFLPDGSGVTYSTTLTYNQFPAGATLTNGNLVTVFANIEHSYFGDLDIKITCPNLQTIWLAGQTGGINEFLGEPIDIDANLSPGVGYDYRWTDVAPTYNTFDYYAGLSTFPFTHAYTDLSGKVYPSTTKYFPAGTYLPVESFSNLVGCPLNGDWTISVKDNIASDNGFIFKWGLELDKSLMPSDWEYASNIISYDWTGSYITEAHPTDYSTTITPLLTDAYIYTLTVADDYGCTTAQNVNVTVLVVDFISWTGIVSTDWNTAGNWSGNAVPTSTVNVRVPDVTNKPIISGGYFECRSLDIRANSTVTIAKDGGLTVNGTLINDALNGTTGIIVQSDASGTGSLIHSTSGISGTVQSYMLSGASDQWHYVSSPINNAANSLFPASVGYLQNLYSWNATLNWLGMTGGAGASIDYTPWEIYSNSLITGQGYSYFTSTRSVDYQGILNTGDITKTLYNYTAGTQQNQGWNLLGNPYPADLDWDLVITNQPASVEKALYLYSDADMLGDQNNYKYYLPATGTAVAITAAGSQISAINSKYIPVGQAFFVRSNTDNVTFTFNNTHKAHSSQTFYKVNEPKEETGVLRLKISKDGISDYMVVRYVSNACFDFDANYDARKLFPSNPAIPMIYSLSQDKGTMMAINSFGYLNQNDIIPIGFNSQSGTLIIDVIDNTFNSNNEIVYLYDSFLETYTNLYQNSNYNFVADEGLTDNRFYLIIRQNNVPVLNITYANQTATEDMQFTFNFDQSTFVDNDLFDAITYSVAKPDWLSFDTNTLSFEGTPNNSLVGNYNIEITATDKFGASSTQTIALEVLNTNDTPVLVGNIENQSVFANQSINVTIPNNLFNDIDLNDILTLQVSEQGNSTITSWFSYDNDLKIITFNPGNNQIGIHTIIVKATDLAGTYVTESFAVEVKNPSSAVDIVNSGLYVYPNPNTGKFTVELTKTSKYHYVIKDINGKIIIENNCSENKLKIDMSKYAKGSYMITIKFEDNSVLTQKLVIQ